jgi:hypothetical protein
MVPQGGGGSLTGSASPVNFTNKGSPSLGYPQRALWYLNGLQQ